MIGEKMPEITAVSEAEKEDIDVIEAGLREFNRRHTGLEKVEKQAVYIKNDGDICGGIVYACLKPWTYIKLLWVSDELRGGGYGAKLMKAAEDDARKRGSTKVMVDTFSFQAPEFYKKLGYSEVSRIDGYPIEGASRIWLVKQL